MNNSEELINKSLSIRIATNGLSFCTYTPMARQPFVYKEWDVNPTISLAANLKNALMMLPMLKETYQRVNVMIVSPRTTAIPVVDFDAEKIEDIYNFNFPNAEGMHTTYNIMRKSGIAVVFGIEKNIYQLLLDDFPNARFYASQSTLMEYFGNKTRMSNKRWIFAYMHEREVTLYAFNSGRFICFNTFAITTADDGIYYILSLLQQLNFSQVEDTLTIIGNTGQEGDLSAISQNFFKNVTVVDCKEEFRNSITGGEPSIPFDLQTLLICGF